MEFPLILFFSHQLPLMHIVETGSTVLNYSFLWPRTLKTIDLNPVTFYCAASDTFSTRIHLGKLGSGPRHEKGRTSDEDD